MLGASAEHPSLPEPGGDPSPQMSEEEGVRPGGGAGSERTVEAGVCCGGQGWAGVAPRSPENLDFTLRAEGALEGA